MRVLGIDPGYGRVGWAVVEGNRSTQKLIGVGCLETSPEKDLDDRLVEIFLYTQKIIQEFGVDSAAVEELFYFKNQTTVMGVGQARGVIVLAIKQAGLHCGHYTPLQIKNTVAGYGKASKKQVQLMVKSQLKLQKIPRPDDASDACAVALTHFFMDSRLQ